MSSKSLHYGTGTIICLNFMSFFCLYIIAIICSFVLWAFWDLLYCVVFPLLKFIQWPLGVQFTDLSSLKQFPWDSPEFIAHFDKNPSIFCFFLPLIFENFQESHTRRPSNLNLNIFFCNEKLKNDKPQIKHNLLDLLTEKTGKSSLWHLHPTIVYITRTLTLYDQNHMLIIK